ncbi:MAG: nitronate monooxygenase [Chloroflexi bacterium]|nr:nitronate monooxygenase [Chloroflexota bacterium]
MGPFTDARLAAAVSNAGALGSIGAANRTPDALTAEIERMRELTNRPFVVNHLVSNLDRDAFSLTLEMKVPIVSFALGDPSELVQLAHDAGALVIQQVHTVAQARQAAGRGVDVVIAQGGEAGGFGQHVGALALVPQVVDAVHPIPVLAAGGIADGRGLAASLVLGAQGVNLGTRFLASVEAPIGDGYKKAILAAQSEQTTKVEVWNDFMPAPGRGGYGTVPRAIRTPFIESWEGRRVEASMSSDQLRSEVMTAAQQGRFHEYVPFAGQSVGLIQDILPAAEIVKRIVTEAQLILAAAHKFTV